MWRREKEEDTGLIEEKRRKHSSHTTLGFELS